jgi:hypothetical protein
MMGFDLLLGGVVTGITIAIILGRHAHRVGVIHLPVKGFPPFSDCHNLDNRIWWRLPPVRRFSGHPRSIPPEPGTARILPRNSLRPTPYASITRE